MEENLVGPDRQVFFFCPLRLRELVQLQTGSRESIIVREVEHDSKTTRSFY